MKSKRKLRSWLSIGAVGCAGLLLAAGCGSESASTESSSPIDDYLGLEVLGGFDEDAIEQDFAEQQRQMEESVAACMKKEGFEYTPSDNGSFVSFGDESGLEYGSREWVEKYGFGISTERFSQSEVGPELVGFDDSAFEDMDESGDPNQEYIESLDEAGQEAYYKALYGEDAIQEFDDTMVEEETEEFFEPSGCQGEAFTAGNSDFAFYEEFGDELEKMYDDVQADPKVASKLDEVRACVTKAGHELPSQWPETYDQNGISMYEEELKAIEALVGYGEDPFADVDFESMSEDEINAMFEENDGGVEFTAEAKTLLGELQSKEITVALAVEDCDGNQNELFELFEEVFRDYEERFVETNKDRLDTFKAKQETTE